jgi:pyrimidine deaminase RibD-like protein
MRVFQLDNNSLQTETTDRWNFWDRFWTLNGMTVEFGKHFFDRFFDTTPDGARGAKLEPDENAKKRYVPPRYLLGLIARCFKFHADELKDLPLGEFIILDAHTKTIAVACHKIEMPNGEPKYLIKTFHQELRHADYENKITVKEDVDFDENQLIAEARKKRKRKPKDIIDGVIKSLIRKGRTEDEAVADLKKQIDKKFYAEDQQLIGALLETEQNPSAFFDAILDEFQKGRYEAAASDLFFNDYTINDYPPLKKWVQEHLSWLASMATVEIEHGDMECWIMRSNRNRLEQIGVPLPNAEIGRAIDQKMPGLLSRIRIYRGVDDPVTAIEVCAELVKWGAGPEMPVDPDKKKTQLVKRLLELMKSADKEERFQAKTVVEFLLQLGWDWPELTIMHNSIKADSLREAKRVDHEEFIQSMVELIRDDIKKQRYSSAMQSLSRLYQLDGLSRSEEKLLDSIRDDELKPIVIYLILYYIKGGNENTARDMYKDIRSLGADDPDLDIIDRALYPKDAVDERNQLDETNPAGAKREAEDAVRDVSANLEMMRLERIIVAPYYLSEATDIILRMDQKYVDLVVPVLEHYKHQIIRVLLQWIRTFSKPGMPPMTFKKIFDAFDRAKINWSEIETIKQSWFTGLEEAWSKKYKRSINCSHPKGFSQKAHCAARRKRRAGGKTKSKSVSESTVPAEQILDYVKQIHPEGEFNIDHVITDHPHWTTAVVPVNSLHIFDPEQDDIHDPYNRVQDTDLYHVDRLIPNIAAIVKQKPLVIDDKGYILDGNHRALAAQKAGLKTVPVWKPSAKMAEEIIRLGGRSEKALAWIEKVYAQFPQTWQHNHVMPLGGEGDDQQFALFELVPSFSKRGAVEIKWFQAYPLRQGVGSRAMRVLQDLAQANGIELTLYPWEKGQVSQASLNRFYKGHGFKPAAKGSKNLSWSPMSETAQTGPAQIAAAFMADPIGKQYAKADCKTSTRAFVKWATAKGFKPETMNLAPPSAETVKQRPELKGQSGHGDGHIFPIINGYGIDFTATQFPGVTQVPLITPVAQIPTVYKRIGGYYTDAPEWMGGKTSWQGPWDQIPADVMKDKNFADNYFKEDRTTAHDRLDAILENLCRMVDKGQSKDPKRYGMVAACVLDTDNHIVTGINLPAAGGKRRHAERVAIDNYHKKYGEIPKGSIIVTTCSPCSKHMDERYKEDCTQLISDAGIEKVYCGFNDPTQEEENRQFNLIETSNQKIRDKCKQFAEHFMDYEREQANENFADGKGPTLYHGTLTKNVPSIMKSGLLPRVGQFTKGIHGDKAMPKVFATTEQGARAVYCALASQIYHAIGHMPSAAEMAKLGAVLVIHKDAGKFSQYDPSAKDVQGSLEPGDYYSDDAIAVDEVVTGQALLDWIKRHDADLGELEMGVEENFADGRGPGRPGDSQRHGIPKGATIAQLEKAAKAKGRKGQLARWQLNMRRGKKKAANESATSMSTEDMIAYLRTHHDENLHSDYLTHLQDTNSQFVLKTVEPASLRTDLSGLERAKVERYKKSDFNTAPPIVIGSDGNILDGYHRAVAAKELKIPTIKAYIGVKAVAETTQLLEYRLDTTQYGGWITPDRKVEYVERQQHEPHVWTQHGATYSQAFQRGFVRFTTSERTGTFGIEGTAEALKKTYRIWAPTAFSMHTVMIDIALYTDVLYKEGMIPSMTYIMPEDKAEVVKLFGPRITVENLPESKPAAEPQGAALTVFDIDETLFHTAAKINVIKDNKVVDSLDNQQFNNYQLKPGESFDFKQFRDAQLFHDTSVPIKKMWQRAQDTLSQIGKRPGSRVIIVTARSDLDDKETFLDTFRKYGLDIDKMHVHRAGNLPIPAAAAKKAIIGKYLESGQFTEVRLFDDAESNLRSFLELRKDYPQIKFAAYMVLESGDVKPYTA